MATPAKPFATKIYGFSTRNVKRLRAVVNKVEAQRLDRTGIPTDSSVRSPKLYIKLIAEGTSGSVGWYSWKKVYWSGDGWVDTGLDSGGQFSARDLNGQEGLAADFVAEVEYQAYRADNSVPVYLFNAGGTGTGGATEFKVTVGGLANVTARPWNGSAFVGSATFTIVVGRYYDVGEIIYAVPITGPIDLGEWSGMLRLPQSTDTYAVLQVADSAGRIIFDWVRAH